MQLSDMTDKRTHWETIYQTKKPDSVSWYQPSLRLSIELILRTGVAKGAALIDVGGGASTLVDDLLSLQYSNITVLDISAQALEYSKNRLASRADSVKWVLGDITAVDLSESSFDVWHDRAVFHFLVREKEGKGYCKSMETSVRRGGFVVIATFGPNGPLKCSGLEIVRYDPTSLQRTLGDAFSLMSSQVEHHTTPFNTIQEFVYCLFKKVK